MTEPVVPHPELNITTRDICAYRDSFLETDEWGNQSTPWLAELAQSPVEFTVPDGMDAEAAALWASSEQATRANLEEFDRRYGRQRHGVYDEWLEMYGAVTHAAGRIATRLCATGLFSYASLAEQPLTQKILASGMGVGALIIGKIIKR